MVSSGATELEDVGRAITEGPRTEIYPQPALPPLILQRVSALGVQRILALARRAGAEDRLAYDEPPTGSYPSDMSSVRHSRAALSKASTAGSVTSC